MTDATDESQWSTRYYRGDCPDVDITIATDGPDDRFDPVVDDARCLIVGHGRHRLIRISPDEYERRRGVRADWPEALIAEADAEDDEDDDDLPRMDLIYGRDSNFPR